MAQSNDTRLPALQLTMLRIEHNPHKSPLPGQAALWVELTAAGTERCNLDDLSKQQFDGIMAELRKAQAKCFSFPAVTRVRELREKLVNAFARLRTAEGDIAGLKNEVQRTVIDGDAAQLKDARKRLEDGQAAVAEAREEVELLKQALPGARANAIKAIREVIGKEISRLQEKFLKQRIPLQNELAAAIQSLAMPILLADRAVSVFDQSAPALRWGNKDLLAEFGALPAELQSDPAAPQESGPQHDFWDGRGPKPPSPPRPFELEAFPERPLMNRDAVEILGTGPIVSAGPQGIF